VAFESVEGRGKSELMNNELVVCWQVGVRQLFVQIDIASV